MYNRITSTILIAGFILIFVSGLTIVINSSASPMALAIDIFKQFSGFFFQFIIITLVGGIMIKEYERSREKRQAKKEFRKSLRRKLVASYLIAKRARWDLRANDRSGVIHYHTYQKSILKLVELKSEIEVLQYEVEGFPEAFEAEQMEEVLMDLKKIEKFIDDLVDECQKKAKSSGGELAVEDFPLLKGFLRPRKDATENKEDTPFGMGCRVPLKNTIKILNFQESNNRLTVYLKLRVFKSKQAAVQNNASMNVVK